MIKNLIQAIISEDEKKSIELFSQYLESNPETEEDIVRLITDDIDFSARLLIPLFKEYEEMQKDLIEALRTLNAKSKILLTS